MNRFLSLTYRNFLFWFSRKIDYPMLPPDMVQVNFTFDCNIRCKMCGMHEQKNSLVNEGRQVEIDSVVFKKIIRDTVELKANNILFIGGEPLLRSDLFGLVKYAKSFNLNTIVVTNGILLKEPIIEKCFESQLNCLSISIDAATEETFSKIRGENYLRHIVENCKVLDKLKRIRKKEFPKMIVVCTIMNENLKQLLDVVSLSRELGAERILFQPVVANNIDQTQRTADFPGFVFPENISLLDSAIDRLIAYKKFSSANFDFIGNSTKHLKLMKKYFRKTLRYRMLPCYAGYNRLQIAQEGKLYFCVNQNNYIATFGDVGSDSLRDLWVSRKAKFYRKVIKECRSPCLQLCSYRDEFVELFEMLQKKIIFSKKRNSL